MLKKHLVIVGAQRSATTYLYHMLDQHPEIFMAKPMRPEPKFFIEESLYSKGVKHYISKYFQNYQEPRIKVWGEKSTSYIEYPEVPNRLVKMLPNAKVVFIFRNPIERAISNYWFSKANGLERLPLEEALSRELTTITPFKQSPTFSISVNPQAYLQRGLYYHYVLPYIEVLGIDNIYLELTENLVGNLDNIRKIYSWLNVESNFEPKFVSKVINQSNKVQQQLSSHLTKLLIEYFRDSNEALSKLLGIDVTQFWGEYICLK